MSGSVEFLKQQRLLMTGSHAAPNSYVRMKRDRKVWYQYNFLSLIDEIKFLRSITKADIYSNSKPRYLADVILP
jgi:hypothetical protein